MVLRSGKLSFMGGNYYPSSLPQHYLSAGGAVRFRVPTVSFNTPLHNYQVTKVCSDGAGGAATIPDVLLSSNDLMEIGAPQLLSAC